MKRNAIVKSSQKSIVRRRKKSLGASMVEYAVALAVIVALGIPLVQMLYGKLTQAAGTGGDKINQAVSGK